jgi:cytochrome c biogenesis protein CcmG/thiol:disulfide interchange protein DsbE
LNVVPAEFLLAESMPKTDTETFVRSSLVLLILLSAAPALVSQEKPLAAFSDPLVLLQTTAKTYANGADTFRLEWNTEDSQTSEMRRESVSTRRTAIKGTDNLYRIEAHTSFGTYIQVSDGVNEWVYQVESNAYVKRPVARNWPEFPKVMDPASHEVKRAWEQRTWLEEELLSYKHAIMLPEETIEIDGHKFPCYVVHASSEDSVNRHDKDTRWEMTFWIDRKGLVVRRTRRTYDGSHAFIPTIPMAFHGDSVSDYPVAEFDPDIAPETFRFSPPADAKQVATLEPDLKGRIPVEHPKAQMVGITAPNVTVAGKDGKSIALADYRGKPLLIDFWATWCGPCLISMPALKRIYTEGKAKGLAVVSIDENNTADDGPVYFTRHHYSWPNFHDEDKAVLGALQGDGIPLTVLIDAQGKIVYYDFAGDETGLRKAIAALGPEFASLAAPAATR